MARRSPRNPRIAPLALAAWRRAHAKGSTPLWKGDRAMSFAYITEEGAYIQKRGGCFTVGRNQECIMEIPAETLEGLTLIDAVQVSSKAIVELLRLGIPVTWLSRTGYFFGRLESTGRHNIFKDGNPHSRHSSPSADTTNSSSEQHASSTRTPTPCASTSSQTTPPSARGALAIATSRTSSYFRESLIKQSLRMA